MSNHIKEYIMAENAVTSHMIDKTNIICDVAMDRFSKYPLLVAMGVDPKVEKHSTITLLRTAARRLEVCIMRLEKEIQQLEKICVD